MLITPSPAMSWGLLNQRPRGRFARVYLPRSGAGGTKIRSGHQDRLTGSAVTRISSPGGGAEGGRSWQGRPGASSLLRKLSVVGRQSPEKARPRGESSCRALGGGSCLKGGRKKPVHDQFASQSGSGRTRGISGGLKGSSRWGGCLSAVAPGVAPSEGTSCSWAGQSAGCPQGPLVPCSGWWHRWPRLFLPPQDSSLFEDAAGRHELV